MSKLFSPLKIRVVWLNLFYSEVDYRTFYVLPRSVIPDGLHDVLAALNLPERVAPVCAPSPLPSRCPGAARALRIRHPLRATVWLSEPTTRS